MRLALCALVMTIPVLATAEGFEAAARIGASGTSRQYECDGASYADREAGVSLDGEGGWRVARHLSIAAFAGYSMIPDEGSCYDLGTRRWNRRDHIFDGGVRLTVASRGLFVGFGLGMEATLESGRTSWEPSKLSEAAAPAEMHEIHAWNEEALLEAHAGVNLGRPGACNGCAIHLFTMVTHAGDVDTLRLALGVQF